VLVVDLRLLGLGLRKQPGAATGQPALARIAAIISLCLWFGVAWGGRWIGFS
jgi:hypothetical protein